MARNKAHSHRTREFSQQALLTVLVLASASGLAANTFPTASSTASCPNDTATRIKNIDPLHTQTYLPYQGFNTKATSIVRRYLLGPGALGARNAKGTIRSSFSCLTPSGRRNFGTRKNKFRQGGQAATVQRFNAGARCDWYEVWAELLGGQKQPPGKDVAMTTYLQNIDLDADADCHDVDTLCLGKGNRFKTEMTWRDFSGNQGTAVPVATGADTGMFYFFDQNNTEAVIKVLDACDDRSFNRFWVFFGATTSVEFTLTVTDTQEGATKTYTNPLGTPFQAITDTQAFATCP